MYTVTVAFRADREYEFHVHAEDVAGLDSRSAREWLHDEFDELECTPTNPVGKVLIAAQDATRLKALEARVARLGGTAVAAEPGWQALGPYARALVDGDAAFTLAFQQALAALDPADGDTAWGLIDLGIGMPGLGHVKLSDLASIVGPHKQPVMRDRYFQPVRLLSEYLRLAEENGSITD